MAEKTIACHPGNVREFQQIVRTWPELGACVRHLQAQGLFPGLRAVRITLVGDAAHLAQGLQGLLPPGGGEGAP